MKTDEDMVVDMTNMIEELSTNIRKLALGGIPPKRDSLIQMVRDYTNDWVE